MDTGRGMRRVLSITARELASYFNSSLATIVLPIFLVLVGVFSLFFSDLFNSGKPHEDTNDSSDEE